MRLVVSFQHSGPLGNGKGRKLSEVKILDRTPCRAPGETTLSRVGAQGLLNARGFPLDFEVNDVPSINGLGAVKWPNKINSQGSERGGAKLVNFPLGSQTLLVFVALFAS